MRTVQMLEGLQHQLQEASAQRSKAEDYANGIKVSRRAFFLSLKQACPDFPIHMSSTRSFPQPDSLTTSCVPDGWETARVGN